MVKMAGGLPVFVPLRPVSGSEQSCRGGMSRSKVSKEVSGKQSAEVAKQAKIPLCSL